MSFVMFSLPKPQKGRDSVLCGDHYQYTKPNLVHYRLCGRLLNVWTLPTYDRDALAFFFSPSEGGGLIKQSLVHLTQKKKKVTY